MAGSSHRPVKGASGAYACRQGFKPCNSDWLKDAQAVEYAVCVPENASIETDCPITYIRFSLDGVASNDTALYKQAAFDTATAAPHKVYFSKKVKANPVDEVILATAQPCWSDLEESFAPGIPLFAGEIRGNIKKC